MIGTLSDAAYGINNKYALADIAAIQKYIAYPYTSNDTGYRKPYADGLPFLTKKMNADVAEAMFAGDEEKDILCAKNAEYSLSWSTGQQPARTMGRMAKYTR